MAISSANPSKKFAHQTVDIQLRYRRGLYEDNPYSKLSNCHSAFFSILQTQRTAKSLVFHILNSRIVLAKAVTATGLGDRSIEDVGTVD